MNRPSYCLAIRQCQLHMAVFAILCGTNLVSAQDTARIDFARDVQPLFRAHCISCHGPKQQQNGFRLDRRRDAFKGGTIAQIGPGNSEASRLYLRLIGDQTSPQMPPEGPLNPEQVGVIKAWIDQGADWPDAASGETPPAPPDPKATRLIELLRDGNLSTFSTTLRNDPVAVRGKGAGGATPLMYAVLYGDADSDSCTPSPGGHTCPCDKTQSGKNGTDEQTLKALMEQLNITNPMPPGSVLDFKDACVPGLPGFAVTCPPTATGSGKLYVCIPTGLSSCAALALLVHEFTHVEQLKRPAPPRSIRQSEREAYRNQCSQLADQQCLPNGPQRSSFIASCVSKRIGGSTSPENRDRFNAACKSN